MVLMIRIIQIAFVSISISIIRMHSYIGIALPCDSVPSATKVPLSAASESSSAGITIPSGEAESTRIFSTPKWPACGS